MHSGYVRVGYLCDIDVGVALSHGNLQVLGLKYSMRMSREHDCLAIVRFQHVDYLFWLSDNAIILLTLCQVESIYDLSKVVVSISTSIQQPSILPSGSTRLYAYRNVVSSCPIILLYLHHSRVYAHPIGQWIVHEQNKCLAIGLLNYILKPLSGVGLGVVQIANATCNCGASVVLPRQRHACEHEVAINERHILVVCY